MVFGYCSSGAIVMKAGKGVNSTAAASAALLQQLSADAEAYLNVMTRHAWDTAPFPSTSYLPILSYAASCIAGAQLVAYDMSGYISRAEAEDIINLLHDRANKIIEQIKEKNVQDTMGV
jgi:hypothetical protein